MSNFVLKVTVEGGKYTVTQDEQGHLTALRYGKPWRDCVGDNLILALAQEIQNLRDQVCPICRQVIKEPGDRRDIDGRLWCKQCLEAFDAIDRN